MKPVEIPLDVELEDKVLWQFTLRQLLIVAAAGLAGWVGYRLTPESWPFAARLLAFGVPPVLGGLLALLEIHGRPLYRWIAISAAYLWRGRRAAYGGRGIDGFASPARVRWAAPRVHPRTAGSPEGAQELGARDFPLVLEGQLPFLLGLDESVWLWMEGGNDSVRVVVDRARSEGHASPDPGP